MMSPTFEGEVDTENTRGSWLAYGLLWSLGFYLRLTILIVPPLIPYLKRQLGFSDGEVAMATSLPLVALACGALVAGWLLARLGPLRCMLGGLAIMAVGSALRAWPSDFAPFLAATLLMGAGIAFMQTAMPILAKAWVPTHIGRASAVYTNGLLVGELLAAGATGSLVKVWLGESWQWVFALWSLPVPALMIAFVMLGCALPQAAATQHACLVLPDVRDGRMWRLVMLLGCAAALYFCGNVFLPPILEGSARLDLLDPSLVALNATQLLSSGLLIVWADKLLGRRWPLIIITLCALVAIPAMLLSPGQSIVFTAGVFGFFTSSLFIFVLALPAWLASAEQLPRLTSGVFFFGYLLVFAITVSGGWISDISGYVALAFVPTLILSLVAMAGTKRLLVSSPQ